MENEMVDSRPVVADANLTLVFDKKSNRYIRVNKERMKRHGVEFDEDGSPIWFTVPEWFDELDRQLIEGFEKQEKGKGEEYRRLANENRAEWNRKGTWHFRQLDVAYIQRIMAGALIR